MSLEYTSATRFHVRPLQDHRRRVVRCADYAAIYGALTDDRSRGSLWATLASPGHTADAGVVVRSHDCTSTDDLRAGQNDDAHHGCPRAHAPS